MKYIVVIIPKFNFYKVIFEDEFIDGNEFKTQNLTIEVLKTLGLERKDFTCDLYSKQIKSK